MERYGEAGDRGDGGAVVGVVNVGVWVGWEWLDFFNADGEGWAQMNADGFFCIM